MANVWSLVRPRLTAALVMWPSLIFAQTPPATVAPQPTTIDGAVAHVYKTIAGTELRLHVFSPARSDAGKRQAAIVFFFGGGWRQGSITQFVQQAQHLASRGMVAIVADYRVSGRHQTTPFEAIADGKSALRWVRAHAGQLAIDPDRIAAAGGSAGGHVALSTAVLSRFDEPGEDTKVSSKPNALVLFNPAVDTSAIAQFGARGQEGSPFHHLTAALPPTLILHGDADTTVPYDSVVRFCEKATALGASCQLVGYKGATHGFFNPSRDEGKWYRETLQEADRFLSRIGYLPSKATDVRLTPHRDATATSHARR